MPPFPRGILFSDVDGTFVDAAYRPALTGPALRRALDGWRLIFVSSRTADELHALHARIGLRDDAIGENGGVLLTYDADTAAASSDAEPLHDAWVLRLAAPVATVRAAWHAAAAVHDGHAEDVGRWDAPRMAAASGYGVDDAARALHRRCSLLLTEPDAGAQRALAALRADGHTVVHGGRWTSIIHGSDKGRAVRAWCARHAPGLPTAAVGDAENDVALLSAADHRFVMWTDQHPPHPALLALEGAYPVPAPGQDGWRALLALLTSPDPEAP
jgi:mannosyl-3-phosphoglycerate phosphatase